MSNDEAPAHPIKPESPIEAVAPVLLVLGDDPDLVCLDDTCVPADLAPTDTP